MKRIVIFKNGTPEDGKVIVLPETVNQILEIASTKLKCNAKKLFTAKGGLIDDIDLIRDDEIIYVSEGEKFIHNYSCPSVNSGENKPDICIKKACTKDEWLTLNVGGKMFTTTRSTLTGQNPGSMLARMFTDDKGVGWKSSVDENGAYLIDRSAIYFEPIINYLRHNCLVLDKNINPYGVLEEAQFFGLTSLIDQLEEIIEMNQPANDETPITRRELVLKLLGTSTNTELRCQGMNFTGANLTKLDLRNINFKYAVLHKANLTGANLACCNFERADLSKAVFDSANLLGVKMLCANLEGSSLKGCNFEDPAGSRANMEGAHMKSVNLEGSHMAGVNLRVATLKNANLQNCDLRGAVLAGADLENCNLSGCDLQEANLRGANLKDAAFELMLNPLHMAQAVR
ncbi:hypothetical protein SNE40_017793 [Patella caerulea]|uniref:KHA domain-containing protein n=1 Tax=Patella caerulea TaxID=87958 RepID=A0AAN8PAD3_PATCE